MLFHYLGVLYEPCMLKNLFSKFINKILIPLETVSISCLFQLEFLNTGDFPNFGTYFTYDLFIISQFYRVLLNSGRNSKEASQKRDKFFEITY